MVKPPGANSRGSHGQLPARREKRKEQSYLNLGGGHSRVGPTLPDQSCGPGATAKASPAGMRRGDKCPYLPSAGLLSRFSACHWSNSTGTTGGKGSVDAVTEARQISAEQGAEQVWRVKQYYRSSFSKP